MKKGNKFTAGDYVVYRHVVVRNGGDVVMLVLGEARGFSTVNNDNNKSLIGIRCGWFDTIGAYHEHVFHTHDLIPFSQLSSNNKDQ